MKNLLSSMIVAFATLLAAPASACECRFSALDTEGARSADHVFVFRIVEARMLDEVYVEAGIKVLQTLHGDATSFRAARYTTRMCCGSRFDIGHVYIAFVHGDGRSFDANSGSVGDVTDLDHGPDSELIRRVRSLLAGKATLAETLGTAAFDRINQVQPPPPPCKEFRQ